MWPAVRPQLCAVPALTALKLTPGGAETATGVVLMPPVVPLPRPPSSLNPQQYAAPSVVRPQACPLPALSAVKTSGGRGGVDSEQAASTSPLTPRAMRARFPIRGPRRARIKRPAPVGRLLDAARSDHAGRALGREADRRADRERDARTNRLVYGIHAEAERDSRAGERRRGEGEKRHARLQGECARHRAEQSEERRVGKECRSRWSPYH